MRAKFGNFLMLLGVALVIAAVLLFYHNKQEAMQAEEASESLLSGVVEQIAARSEMLAECGKVPDGAVETIEPLPSPTAAPQTGAQGEPMPAPFEELLPTSTPEKYIDPYDKEMTVVKVKGEGYIGVVTIPKLGLELPVMSDWSYPKLRRSPCHFSGSTKTDDLVIFAHNYSRHFGKLNRLSAGDMVAFTDMNGVVTRYQVVDMDELSPYAVAEMVSGEFDLTLFTCTYGGKRRVSVRCDRI